MRELSASGDGYSYSDEQQPAGVKQVRRRPVHGATALANRAAAVSSVFLNVMRPFRAAQPGRGSVEDLDPRAPTFSPGRFMKDVFHMCLSRGRLRGLSTWSLMCLLRNRAPEVS